MGEDLHMRGKHWQLLVIGTSLLLVGGCASSEEWNTWRSTPATSVKEHSIMQNTGGTAPATNQDVALAQSRTAWSGGTVNQDQILSARPGSGHHQAPVDDFGGFGCGERGRCPRTRFDPQA
jgi:hypothetical protein